MLKTTYQQIFAEELAVWNVKDSRNESKYDHRIIWLLSKNRSLSVYFIWFESLNLESNFDLPAHKLASIDVVDHRMEEFVKLINFIISTAMANLNEVNEVFKFLKINNLHNLILFNVYLTIHVYLKISILMWWILTVNYSKPKLVYPIIWINLYSFICWQGASVIEKHSLNKAFILIIVPLWNWSNETNGKFN